MKKRPQELDAGQLRKKRPTMTAPEVAGRGGTLSDAKKNVPEKGGKTWGAEPAEKRWGKTEIAF